MISVHKIKIMAELAEEICHNKLTKCLKIPSKSKEQICLIFLIPAMVNCFVYIIHFSADLVVAIQHFRENSSINACITICLMYAPAFAYFIFTISRPDWWMTDDDKMYKGAFTWFLIQVGKLIAFPFFALYRCAGLIVLLIDTIILQEDQRMKTLNIASAPAAIELYFFLQAWFQAIPQAVFQTFLFFKKKSISRTYQSEAVHILCIFMSICVIAIRTTQFQRYESQRTNGRKVPWAMWLNKLKIQELENVEEKKLLQSMNAHSQSGVRINQKQIRNKNCEHEQEFHSNLDKKNCSTPPLPPKNLKIIPPPTPLRGITSITRLPVPEMPAPPRPDSIIDDSEKAQIELPNSAIDKKTDRAFERNNNLRIQRHKNCTKSLKNDDPVGTFFFFLWWFLFILPRVLSISIFFEFYPVYLFIVLGVHYTTMIAYLFYYAKYYDVMSFFINLWLGIIYIFSIIEYRVKFKYADKWLRFYYIFVIIQNTLMTLVWYFYGDWDRFGRYSYSFYMIFICTSLYILSTIVYYLLFKPKKRKIYAT